MEERKYYLAHHGIKGMRWGVRRKRGGQKTKVARKSKLKADSSVSELIQDYERSQRSKRVAKGALTTVGVLAVGTAAAAVPLYVGKKFVDAILGA